LGHSYLPDLGVRSLRRSILVNVYRFVVGVDLIDLENKSTIEWNLHSRGRFTKIDGGKGLAFTIGDTNSKLIQLHLHCSDNATWRTGLSDFVPAYPNDGIRDRHLQIATEAQTAAFFWCIVLSGDVPNFSQTAPDQGAWTFKDATTLNFDGTWISQAGAR
jgi:hypothetical protein